MMPRVPSQVPEGLLYVLTAFGPFAFGCVEPWSRACLEILAFLLALSCFLSGRRDLPPLASWFWLFPASFAVLGALQLLTPMAPDLPRPMFPFTTAAHATQASVLLWTAYAAMLWSVPQVIATHETARRYARVLFWLGVALAAQGMLQAATGGNKPYWLRPASDSGVFGPYYNRDHAANFLMMAMAVGIGILWSKMRRRPEVDGPAYALTRSQSLLAGGIALLFVGIAVCGSRGAYLAVPLAGALLVLLGAGFAKRARSRRLRAGAAVAFAAAVVFFTFRHVGASADAGALTDPSILDRFFIYGDSWNWLRDSPVFGTGLGSFETVYPAYQSLDLTALVEHAHSDWLELALETGLVGLLAVLSAAALAGFGAARAWLSSESREMRALIGGALGAAAAFVIHSLFEFSFHIPGNAVVFFAIVGFLLSSTLWKNKAASRVRVEAPSVWTALAAIACFLCLTHAAARPAAEGDPKRVRSNAAILYARAGSGDKSDAAALRSALRLSLAAAELRPFDYKALSLAGSALARFGREADAGDFFERSRLVRFTPVIVGMRDAEAERRSEEKKFATLKTLGLLPQRFERP
jgi:O-antigen ligase